MGGEAAEVARTHHARHIGHAEQEVDISRFYVGTIGSHLRLRRSFWLSELGVGSERQEE